MNPVLDTMLAVSPIAAIIGLTFVAIEFIFIKKYKAGKEYRL